MPEKHMLRTYRKAAGKTQVKLGLLATVSPGTISDIECHRGPDVPEDQWRPTKTKLATARKLVRALCELKIANWDLPAGEYPLADFVACQSLFTEQEIFEAFRLSSPKRNKKSQQAAEPERHLRLVS